MGLHAAAVLVLAKVVFIHAHTKKRQMSTVHLKQRPMDVPSLCSPKCLEERKELILVGGSDMGRVTTTCGSSPPLSLF